MKQIEKKFPALVLPELPEACPEHTLYFDIETTGLSADTSYVYLIGALTQIDQVPVLKQWFSESPAEEEQLIRDFFKFVSGFELLVHYNGTGFDLPFLQKKLNRYGIAFRLDLLKNYDLYRALFPLKKLLSLPGYKQRTIEEFLGFHRKDPFTGGDLIELYIQYVGRKHYEELHSHHRAAEPDSELVVSAASGLPALPSSEAEALRFVLLLHNEEDLTGLICCMQMRNYLALLCGGYEAEYAEFREDMAVCRLYLRLSAPLPAEISVRLPFPSSKNAKPTFWKLRAYGAKVVIELPCLNGELKYFFPEYSEYYYLPAEDTAIHKSIAEFVDQRFRKKATKETAFQKKRGIFLPQAQTFFTPAFKVSYRDKLSYFEITKEFLTDPKKLYEYSRILFMFSGKNEVKNEL